MTRNSASSIWSPAVRSRSAKYERRRSICWIALLRRYSALALKRYQELDISIPVIAKASAPTQFQVHRWAVFKRSSTSSAASSIFKTYSCANFCDRFISRKRVPIWGLPFEVAVDQHAQHPLQGLLLGAPISSVVKLR